MTSSAPHVAAKQTAPANSPFAPVVIRSSAISFFITGWASLDDLAGDVQLQQAVQQAVREAVACDAAIVLMVTPTPPLGGEGVRATKPAGILRVMTLNSAQKSGAISECHLPIYGLCAEDGAVTGVLTLPSDLPAIAAWLSEAGIEVEAVARLN